MTAQEMLEQAIIELGNLKDGGVFIVKDLFKGHLWNEQERSVRLTLGTLFLNFVKQKQKQIEVLDKNSSGQQEYRLLDGGEFRPLTQKNCFAKTGVMKLQKTTENMIIVSIGTSGLDLCEMALKTEADVDKFTNIIKQSL